MKKVANYRRVKELGQVVQVAEVVYQVKTLAF
jgi:hypothetical protein